jgi:hypothetical protein
MTLREIISESKNVDLSAYGFKRQTTPVVHGHVSWIDGGQNVILIDIPGNEWHYMEDGVVVKVGYTTTAGLNALKQFLSTGE